MKLTVFLLLQASSDWLQLDRATRKQIGDQAFADSFGGSGIAVRFFDAEAFCAEVSDVAMIEADNPHDYYFAIERLRDTPVIAKGYFRVEKMIPSFENGYQEFEDAS
ncbi:darcynin family protein [Hoeflea sp. AS60]|uniref:darcynin family protein n=1 Tax=Hoeflea sp. AS60 TaxID=3135780 RepID=UPI00317B70D2